MMKKPDISRLRKNRGMYFQLGLIVALSMTILAFNYTVYDRAETVEWETPTTMEPVVEVVRTIHKKKPLPPPPKIDLSKEIEPVDETEFVQEPEPEPIPLEVEAPIADKDVVPATKPPAPKPKPVPMVIPEDPAEADVDVLYTIAEYMPEFGDCGTSTDKSERRQISQTNLLKFIYKHIKYPKIALENSIEGRVFVRFVIDEKGFVQDIEILKEPGGGLGREVIRVVKKMPQWKPGKQGLHHVKVQYTLPVEFKPI